MNYLQNLELIKNIGKEIIKPRSYCYSQQMVAEYLKEYRHIRFQKIKIINKAHENLKSSLFINQEKEDICVVFMHGLGSTRLQGLNLLKQLPKGYSLCLFDFSGSGKSDGDKVTYGYKQKQDIEAVLNALRKENYKKFVLWGRSMGAVSALLHSMSYQPNDIILLVLDSPFSSFEIITKELAQKKINVPSFIINILLDLVKSNFKKLDYNPFQINVTNCEECKIPALFIYSQTDEVVNYEHSIRIIANYKAKYDKIIIKDSHNAPRNRQTLKKIYHNIQTYRTSNVPFRKSIFQDENRKYRGINVISRDKITNRPHSSQKNFVKKQSPQQSTESQYYMGNMNNKKGSPNRKIKSFCYDINDEIAYNINKKIKTKMLSNQLYL